MYRLLRFIRRIYVLLVFLILEGFALYFYVNSSVQLQAQTLLVSNRVMGGVYRGIAEVEGYFGLRKTNRSLAGRVEELENELAAYREHYSIELRDSIKATAEFPHEYIVARVVRNTVNRRENYIMVDRGMIDGVERGMAVVSLDGGMVGYVESVSPRNAICVSALNTSFRAGGAIAGSGHFGSISWAGGDARTVKLTEVPKYAEIKRGDTVLTTGYSFHFPEGIYIGTIDGFVTDDATASYDIDVRLGADISSLRDVMLVSNRKVEERILLEEEISGVSGVQ